MTPTITDRICARIVRHLGSRVTALNFLPFGVAIVSRYRIYAVAGSYSNKQKVDTAHATNKFPPRNVAFCEFAVNFAADQIGSVLELGAGRSVNANLIAAMEIKRGNRPPRFVLVDRYVDPARYLDVGIDAECVLGGVGALDLGSSIKFDLGITRATLSVLSPADAKHALLLMARTCRTVILNEAATGDPIKRTMIRSDRHTIHPYQYWLSEAGKHANYHDWSEHDVTFNGIVTAR